MYILHWLQNLKIDELANKRDSTTETGNVKEWTSILTIIVFFITSESNIHALNTGRRREVQSKCN